MRTASRHAAINVARCRPVSRTGEFPLETVSGDVWRVRPLAV